MTLYKQAKTPIKLHSLMLKFQEHEFLILFMVFIISTTFIIIERYTPVYINNFYTRLFFYLISVSLFFLWVAWILFGFKAVKRRGIILSVAVILCSAKAFLWGGEWKTQMILYQNKINDKQTVEFQMRADWFAFGYKKRIVERKRIAPFFDYITDVDTTKLDPVIWKRIDKRINRLKLRAFNDIPSDN